MRTPEDILDDVGLEEGELHRGQLRFAERFTKEYGGKFLHVHGLGWHRYDGSRWAECVDGAEHRAALALIKEARTEIGRMSTDDGKMMLQDIGKVESAAGLAGVLTLAENMHPCTLAAARLDASAYLLNTASGTVDLEAGTVSKQNPSDHLSKVTSAAFDPTAISEEFDLFLKRIQPDPEMRDFLARSLGSALLGVVRDHKLHIWVGVGANGKGTLRDAVLHALGDYAVEVPADLLLVTKYGGSLAPDRMRLKGTRAAFCSEIGNGAKLDEAVMKKLTGGDPVNAKLLYRNPIQFDPSHTLYMLTNHLPGVRGDDPATWRRILAVPFGTVIPPAEMDGMLPERLKANPDAVLAWLWKGWLDYQTNGLNPPKAVLAATKQYQLDSDILARFLDDETAVVIGHGFIKSTDLYELFARWIKSQGEKLEMTQVEFSKAMENKGFQKKRSSAGITWQGLIEAAAEPA